MSKKKQGRRQRATLRYPAHWFTPEDLISFTQLRPFVRRWDNLDLTDLDLRALEIGLMAAPRGGNVISNTGGVRKIRFAPPRWNAGKSGALRVCYKYIEEVAIIILAIRLQQGRERRLN